jgi:hypothetical protein
MKPQPLEVKLTWEQCEILSHYYRFPTAVLLLPEKDMKRRMKGTRRDAVLDKIDKLERIRRLEATL